MNLSQKILKKYVCEYCDYKTYSTKDFNKHLITGKHKNRTKLNVLEQKIPENPKEYICKNCNKFYNARNSLWYHEQKCIENKNEFNEPNITENNLIDKDDLIIQLLKQNTKLMEILENGTHNNINSTNIVNNNNNNNKTFNLHVFLNETCKDAMNITDFVNSIQLQLSDLENVGKVGYIEGISNIIIKNLKALDVEKRPVHCTDQKREVIYVKEDNIWEKEDETNKQLRKAIKLMAHKNICMLKAFREKYPDFDDGDSRRSTQYNKIVIEAMGGKGDNEYEKDTKIIKKITKVVGIDKN
jgi:hypothetical protein